MLSASRSGNTSTLARPATGPRSFSFFAATLSTSAASACSSPSIASCGERRRTISRAFTIFSTREWRALPLVENESSATRGSSSTSAR